MRPTVAGGNIGKPETIGYNRYYETMAFPAVKEGVYWEAQTGSPQSFGSPWAIDHVDGEADLEANDMHEAIVKEFTKRLRTVPPGPGK
jgi:hypothetical protein